MYGHPVITRYGRWHDCVYSIGTLLLVHRRGMSPIARLPAHVEC